VRTHVEAIREKYGTAPLARLEQHHVEADLARLPPHPANARRKAWRLILKNARDIGLARGNPSDGIAKRKTPKTEGYEPWTDDEIDAYRRRWHIGTVQRKAFELLLWTAARTIDGVKIGPAHVGRDGLLVFRQNKTANPAHVPWSCALPTWAEAWEDERHCVLAAMGNGGGFTFLETVEGRVRSPKGLSNLISEAARQAGVRKTAHGLRKTRLRRIAEACGSAHAIMSWGGHVTLSEAQEYCRSADLRRVVMGQNVNSGAPVYKAGA
jgi:hypothetical protein